MLEIDRENEQFNQGVNHVVCMLAKTIAAPDTWVAGDGSEDYDEDLAQTLLNILAARGLYDSDTGQYAQAYDQGAINAAKDELRHEIDRLKAKIEQLICERDQWAQKWMDLAQAALAAGALKT